MADDRRYLSQIDVLIEYGLSHPTTTGGVLSAMEIMERRARWYVVARSQEAKQNLAYESAAAREDNIDWFADHETACQLWGSQGAQLAGLPSRVCLRPSLQQAVQTFNQTSTGLRHQEPRNSILNSIEYSGSERTEDAIAPRHHSRSSATSVTPSQYRSRTTHVPDAPRSIMDTHMDQTRGFRRDPGLDSSRYPQGGYRKDGLPIGCEESLHPRAFLVFLGRKGRKKEMFNHCFPGLSICLTRRFKDTSRQSLVYWVEITDSNIPDIEAHRAALMSGLKEYFDTPPHKSLEEILYYYGDNPEKFYVNGQAPLGTSGQARELQILAEQEESKLRKLEQHRSTLRRSASPAAEPSTSQSRKRRDNRSSRRRKNDHYAPSKHSSSRSGRHVSRSPQPVTKSTIKGEEDVVDLNNLDDETMAMLKEHLAKKKL